MRNPGSNSLEVISSKAGRLATTGRRYAQKILLSVALALSGSCVETNFPNNKEECLSDIIECYRDNIWQLDCEGYRAIKLESCDTGDCVETLDGATCSQNIEDIIEDIDETTPEESNNSTDPIQDIDLITLNSDIEKLHVAQIKTSNYIEINFWGNQSDGDLKSLFVVRMESPEGELYIQSDDLNRPVLVHTDLGSIISVNDYLPDNKVDLSYFTPNGSHARAILENFSRRDRSRDRLIAQSIFGSSNCSIFQNYISYSCDIATIVDQWSTPEGFAAHLVEIVVGEDDSIFNETIGYFANLPAQLNETVCERFDSDCNGIDPSIENIFEDLFSVFPDFSPPPTEDQPIEPDPIAEPPQEGPCGNFECGEGQVPVNGGCANFIQDNSRRSHLIDEKLIMTSAECYQTANFYEDGEDFIDGVGNEFHHCLKSGGGVAITDSYIAETSRCDPEYGNNGFFKDNAGETVILCVKHEYISDLDEGDTVVTHSSFSRDGCPDSSYIVTGNSIELPDGCYTHCIKTKTIE